MALGSAAFLCFIIPNSPTAEWTAPASPWQNAYAERVIGSMRRECLDHTIILGERHLRRTVKKYVDYYNCVRTHLSLDRNCLVGFGLTVNVCANLRMFDRTVRQIVNGFPGRCVGIRREVRSGEGHSKCPSTAATNRGNFGGNCSGAEAESIYTSVFVTRQFQPFNLDGG